MMREKGSGPEFVSLGACRSKGPGHSDLHLAVALPLHTCPGGRCQGVQVSAGLPVSLRETPRRGEMTLEERGRKFARSLSVIPGPADDADYCWIIWKGGPR